MTESGQPGEPESTSGRPSGPDGPRSRRWVVPALVVAVVVLAGILAVVAVDRRASTSAVSSTTVPAPDPSTSLPATTTTAEPSQPAPTTTTTAAPASTQAPAVDTSSAVWPTASGPVYTTPVAAARGFAVDFVGFTSPVVGTFRQGDARSGEVDVRAKANGPVTTVFVRQLGSGGRWFVLGSATPNINVTRPEALAKVTSPVRVQGTSTAFEANVSVQVRQDGTREPIGTGFVMGGSMGQMAPFDGTVSFRRPTAKAGAVLLLTHSAEDGRVWEASTVRVSF